MTDSVIGDCRLCRAAGVPLRDSHIIPKWAYRRARDKTRASGSGDPIQVQDGIAIQTSRQVKEYMLCNQCEQRLCLDEDYVARLAHQDDGTFGILQAVAPTSVVPTGMHAFGTPTRAAPISHLDCKAIARFAASVFWRAHVARRQAVDSLRLWNPQAEALRKFVLGEKPLPSRMCLTMFLPVERDAWECAHSSTLTVPVTGTKGEDSAHQFIVGGLVFNLTTGSVSVPRICLACGTAPHLMIQHWKAIRFLWNSANMIAEAEPKGKGARLFKTTDSGRSAG